MSAIEPMPRSCGPPVWNRSGAQVLEVRLVNQPTQPRLINIPPFGAGTLETLHDGLSPCIKGHVHASGGKRGPRATIDIDSFPIKTQVKLMARHPTFTTEKRTTIPSSPRSAWRPITIAPGRDIAWATASSMAFTFTTVCRNQLED